MVGDFTEEAIAADRGRPRLRATALVGGGVDTECGTVDAAAVGVVAGGVRRETCRLISEARVERDRSSIVWSILWLLRSKILE